MFCQTVKRTKAFMGNGNLIYRKVGRVGGVCWVPGNSKSSGDDAPQGVGKKFGEKRKRQTGIQ